jgi:hypothetical protein
MIDYIYTHITQHKTLYISISIFLLIFCILGLPFTQWGFFMDDFGNIYHAKHVGWNGIWQFFVEGDAEKCRFASNQIRDEGFLCGVYRPLSFIYYLVQYTFFGTNPYAYFLVCIALHAFASVLFFLLLRIITSYLDAFLAALFFGFHPSLRYWLGWTSAQTYHIELCSFLLILLMLHAYFKTHKTKWFMWAHVLFGLTLFLKEQLIILPFWLFFAFYFYHAATTKSPTSTLKKITISIKQSLGFWIVALFYLSIRLINLPFSTDTQTIGFQLGWHNFIIRQSGRLYEFATYAQDMLGINWIWHLHYSLKIAIFIAIFAVILFLFAQNKYKSFMVFLGLSVIIFSWPAIIRYHHPRYSYTALVLMITALVSLKEFYQGRSLYNKNIVYTIVIMLITYNAWFLYAGFSMREQNEKMITTTFERFVQNPLTYNRPLYFIGIPFCYFGAGIAQAVWLYQHTPPKPVYYHIFINYERNNDAATHNDMQFAPIHNGYHVTTTNPEHLWFGKDHGTKICSTTLVIDEKYKNESPLFITWDYEKKDFLILDPPL